MYKINLFCNLSKYIKIKNKVWFKFMNNNIFKKPINVFILALIAMFLWGSAFPAVKIGYQIFRIESGQVYSQILFAGIRFFIAGILVILFDVISKKKFPVPKKDEIIPISLLALVQTTIEYVFFYLSLNNLTGVKGSIINSIGNFFVVILAHFCFKDDKLNFKKIIGCILGFSGVVVCNLNAEIGFGFKFNGDGFITIAAFCFAMGSIMSKKISKKSDPVMVTGYQLALGGFALLLIGAAMGGRLYYTGFGCILIMGYLSLLSSVAFTLWTQLLKYNPAGKIALFGFLNPVFGVITSGIFLKESFLNFQTLAALILVSAGIYIVNKVEV